MQARQLIVQSLGWSKTYGGASNEYAYSVIQTPDGGYSIVGAEGWLVKTDSVGDSQWNKTYGTIQYGIQTSDGGYALAGTNQSSPPRVYPNSNFLLVKTDSAGNEQWRRAYGGPGNEYAEPGCIIQTSDGGYAITGITYAVGGGKTWLVKTDSVGNSQWNRTYGIEYYNRGFSVIQTSDGGYAIAGSGKGDALLVKTNSTGYAQWSKTYGDGATGGTKNELARSVIQTPDGGYALAGTTDTSYGVSDTDAWLVKTDSVGNTQWSRTYGGTDIDDWNSVIQASDGGYAMAGTTWSYGAGESDAWLVKTDSVGNTQWSRTYGGTKSEQAESVIQASDGGYAMAGTTNSYGAGGSDGWLVKIPADSPPHTVHEYDGLWHTADFAIKLSAVDDFTGVFDTYYRINDGSIRSVNINNQPIINVEGAKNKLEYWSTDSLGNEELPHKTLQGIKLDKNAPTGSIILNNGDAFTSSPSVTLALSANDLTSGVSQARYSNDGIWDTEPWETPSAFKTWTLIAGDGIKTVYYQVKDNAGLLSSTYSDTIILETPPTPTPTPTSSPTPTPSPTSTPTPNPTATPSPSSTSTPTSTPIASPSSTPLPTPTTTTPQTSTPTASPTITSSTPTLSPTITPATATPSPSRIQSPSPSPTSQPTETPLYLYALAVFAIAVVSVATFRIVKKRRL